MTYPTPGYSVHTKELRGEAGIWDDQSSQLKEIVEKAEGLRFNHVQAGIFQLLVTAYGPAIDQIIARCSEGQQRVAEIAKVLRDVSDEYDKAEKEGEQLFKSRF